MSTISPFVRIEDSVGRPRTGTHGRLPPPFGHEWSLLNRGSSLRADLSALLRTFCLHEEAIWSMAYWASKPLGQPAVDSAGSGESVAPAFPSATAPRDNVPALASAAHMSPDVPAVHQMSANRFGKRAGGLCAIGGAVILTWLGIGYLSHRQAKQDTTAMQQPVFAQHTPIAVPPDSETREAAAQRHAPVSSPPRPEETTRARHSLRETSPAVRHTSHSSAARTANVRSHSGHAGSSTAGSHRLAHSSRAHRSLARASAAGDYSPFAPATLGRDEYASIAMPTGTRAGHATLAPPAPSSGSVSDTEWMSHISQRRVTEVPDAFSK